MKINKSKILLNISKIDSIKDYKELGVTYFLFPVKDFSVGYESFSLSEIENTGVNAYLLVNRILSDEDIDKFLTLKIPNNVLGIILEDTGLYCALKNRENIELINFQNHLNNNYITINYWLDYFDSLVISTDITFEEIEKILNESSKPLIINTFSYPMIMYSRRKLLKNFYLHENLEAQLENNLSVVDSNVRFKIKESDYGTAIFNNELLDVRARVSSFIEDKIKFYLFDTSFLDFTTVRKAVEGEKIENTTEGFLNIKTIYKVGE